MSVIHNQNKEEAKGINKILFNINGEEKFKYFLEDVKIDNDENMEDTERNMLDKNLLFELNRYIENHFN